MCSKRVNEEKAKSQLIGLMKNNKVSDIL